MILSTNPPVVAMENFFASTTRGLVEAQQALDDDARRRMSSWEVDGIPPHAWTVSRCRLEFPIPLRCLPKSDVAQTTSLWLQPGSSQAAQLTVSIQYRPALLEES